MFRLPETLRQDIQDEVRAAYTRSMIVNVHAVSKTVQLRNPRLNVALEDIEQCALDVALIAGAAVVFDHYADGLYAPLEGGMRGASALN